MHNTLRPRSHFLLICAVLCAFPAHASQVVIGETETVVPQLEGFVSVDLGKSRVHPIIFEIGNMCEAGICTMFMDNESASKFERTEILDSFVPFYIVSIVNEGQRFDSDQFAELAESVMADRTVLTDMLTEAMTQMEISSPEESPAAGKISVKKVDFELLEYDYDNESMVSFSILLKQYYRGETTQLESYSVATTVSIIHANEIILMAYVYGRESDVLWTQGIAGRLAQELRLINKSK